MRQCVFRLVFCVKHFPQKEHLYGFLPIWTITCMRRLAAVFNSFPHIWQTWLAPGTVPAESSMVVCKHPWAMSATIKHAVILSLRNLRNVYFVFAIIHHYYTPVNVNSLDPSQLTQGILTEHFVRIPSQPKDLYFYHF